MALSDNPRSRVKKSPKVRSSIAPTNVHWSDKQKTEAVTSYLLLGNLALTARVLNIPEVTLRYWKQSTWWKEVETEIKLQDDLQLSAKLKKIVEGSLTVVADRIENGDWIYDQKTGQMVRKPVALKDAHKVAVETAKQRQELDKRTVAPATAEQDDDKLKKLAEKFAVFAMQKIENKPEPVVLEMVEEIKEEQDAVHDQREA